MSVGEENPVDFKCHKLILARSSKVFAKLLFGHFKEALHDKDTPIRILGISPTAFSIAMKYVYGNVYNNKSVSLACEVYKFAHFYQIEGLVDAAFDKLKNPTPKDVIPVYELSKLLIKGDALKYLVIIRENTSEVLKSPQFIKASQETLVEICSLDRLKIKSEMELVEALINWAELNASKTDRDELSQREIIDAALKQVRFFTLKGDEFSELCCSTNILSEKEKLQILMSINLNNAKHMPYGFTVSSQFRDVKGHMVLDFMDNIPYSSDTKVSFESSQQNFRFLVRGSDLKYLTSIRLYCLLETSAGLEADLACNLWSTCPEEPLAIAKFRGVVSSASEDPDLHFPRPILLKSGVPYTLTISYYHKTPLRSKIFKNAINQVVWEFPHSDFKMYKSGNVFSHHDIVNLHFITSVFYDQLLTAQSTLGRYVLNQGGQ
ncbi:Hypothetical predicted protein [Cloeon dipterum]|uniref:BTB domain-containing protein n=1 Tax=Cloeon dipterum TaxID=197152 RepID=A0A8S1DNP0_9INSE|nr:Hypothetical predicted protein [Cloeon dipterum]